MSALGLNIRIPRESIIKLNTLQDQELVVKFTGGREVKGKLKSWDKTMNLVLDNALEVIGIDEKQEQTRVLGLIIIKGSQIHSICLQNGYEIIDNPYHQEPLEPDNQEQDCL